MPERDGYIPGVPCWVDTSHPDPQAAADFYSGLFGWECEQMMPEGSDSLYFMARLRGLDVAGIGSTPPGAPPQPMWNSYVWVDSADETATQATAAGGSVLGEPFDVMGAGRMAVLADTEGAVINVWQPREHRGSRLVNEHGTVNFNTLTCNDRDAAMAFYGAVFDWHILSLDSGFTAWTLPGYGDHLELAHPTLRQDMAAVGAPAGFEDVVANFDPMSASDRGAPPNWSVVFAVDDADAIAAKAVELGGKLLMEPFDAPWVRMTVIADPQGAAFLASQFVMENRDVPGQSAPATAA